MDPAEIFKSEAEEAYEKTQKAIEICTSFKEHFEDVRRNIQKFFKEGQEVKQWEFANELVFTRKDQFVQRLRIVEVGSQLLYYCMKSQKKNHLHKFVELFQHCRYKR